MGPFVGPRASRRPGSHVKTISIHCSQCLFKRMEGDHDNVDLKADIVGYVAAVFTTFALLPQIMRIRRLKEAKDVSLLMPSMVATGSALWIVFGFMISSAPIVAANSVALLIALATVFFAVRYRDRQAP